MIGESGYIDWVDAYSHFPEPKMLRQAMKRAQIAVGILIGIIGILVVYYSPYAFDQCLKYVVDCPYYRRVWLEALGFGVLFVGAAIVGLVVRPRRH